jgi:hypothetical protein
MFLEIPESLEVYLTNLVKEALEGSNIETDADSLQFLFAFFEPTRPTQSSDHDVFEEDIDAEIHLRNWVVNNDLMWAGIDRRIDEVFEVLWTLFHWRTQVDIAVDTTTEECVQFLAQHYRSRLPQSLDSETAISSDAHKVPSQGVLPERERLLYLHWVLRWPENQERQYNEAPNMFYSDSDVKYPPPEELFWNNGDEGINDGRDHEWITVEPSVSALGSLMRKRKATI